MKLKDFRKLLHGCDPDAEIIFEFAAIADHQPSHILTSHNEIIVVCKPIAVENEEGEPNGQTHQTQPPETKTC